MVRLPYLRKWDVSPFIHFFISTFIVSNLLNIPVGWLMVDKLLRIYGGSAKNYLNIDLVQLPIYYYLLLELVEYFLLLSCPLLNIYFQRFPDIILFTYFTRRSLSQSSYEINSFPSLSSLSQSSYEINSSLLERR